jgi:hypothetical protein
MSGMEWDGAVWSWKDWEGTGERIGTRRRVGTSENELGSGMEWT